MTEIKSENGNVVRIADEVLAVIAGTAAMEADGVVALAGRKGRSKGVAVAVKDAKVRLRVAITVKAGKKLQEVAREVQQRVRTNIETMTGLDVVAVNVTVLA